MSISGYGGSCRGDETGCEAMWLAVSKVLTVERPVGSRSCGCGVVSEAVGGVCVALEASRRGANGL